MVSLRIVKAIVVAASLFGRSLPKIQRHLGVVLSIIDGTVLLSDRLERKIQVCLCEGKEHVMAL